MKNEYREIQQPEKSGRIRRIVLRVLGGLLGLTVLAFAGLFILLTVTEYQPADIEPAEMSGAAAGVVREGDELTLFTWNIGYGALGDNADFFMDGGRGVITASKERVEQNIADVVREIEQIDPDIALLQEVDTRSRRSSYIDQAQAVSSAFAHMQSSFALNYKTAFVPIGLPAYGTINGGLLTLSAYGASEATRLALPSSYDWPISTVQLKRCQLVVRIPVQGTDRELVIVNEHPDAYTDEVHHAIQVDVIRRTVEDEIAAGNYVIAGGDWNHTFNSVDTSAYPLLPTTGWQAGTIDESEFPPACQFAMDSSHPTCRLLDHPLVNADGTPSDLPMQYYVIDGFMVSDNIRIISTETQDLGFKASDHNPVVMKVVLEQS